ncbi:hypothetical protein ACF0H5_012547 [Mactra antiquata]
MFEYLLSGSVPATCLVAIVVAVLVYWFIQKMKYNYPPGPPGLPLLGNATQMSADRLHEQVYEWSKKYGPVITLRAGQTASVFVNDIESALEVLVKKSNDFASRKPSTSMQVFSYNGKDIIFGEYSPTWKLQRRLSVKALRHYMQADALNERVTDAVSEAFKVIDNIKGEFDPMGYMNFIVTHILSGLCFGGKYSYGDRDMTFVTKKLDELAVAMGKGFIEDFFPIIKKFYKTKNFRDLEDIIRELIGEFLTRKYMEAKKTFNKDKMRHFCDNLILARQELEEEGHDMTTVTQDHFLQTFGDIFLAGIDTSRFTLTWCINYMIAFPDIQKKVQEEIDRVVGKERMPQIDDRPNLVYTEAVLHEVMRMSSVAPLGVPHMTTRDTEIAGYKIPSGTEVVINHYALHHEPTAWREVDRFIPERYLDEDGKLGPKPQNWLPFSAGTRVCLGEFVAKPELHLIFACLMQRYNWKMVSGKCADLSTWGNFFSRLCKPYKVIVEKRV